MSLATLIQQARSAWNVIRNETTEGANTKTRVADAADDILDALESSDIVKTNDSRLSDARPASDVYDWAKAATKPTYTKSEIGLGNVDNTSDVDKPVSTAQQTAIDNAVIGLYDDRGNYDASTNSFPTTGGSGTSGAILKSDIWFISVAGTLGTKSVKQGDTIRARVNAPGQTEANWAITSTGANLSYATQSEAESGTENTKVMTALRVVQSFVYQAINYTFSGLNTTSKKIIGAINENYSSLTELFSRWTDSASTGFVKFDVEAGACHSVTDSTFNLLKSGYGRIKGTKVTFEAQSVAFPASYGLVYAKINSAGVLVTGGSVDYATEFPLFYLFTGVSGTYYVALESHNFNFNTNVSGFLHKAIGVQIVGSGGNVVVANTNTQVAISGNAELLDHGLSADITDTAGVGVVWIQDYLNASGQWALNTLAANLAPRYNVGGTPTLLDSGKFGVYRLYATKQDGNTNAARYLAIMDTAQYSNQNAAQAAINANTVAAASGALVSVEVAQIGFAIVRADGVVVATTVSKQTLTMQSASGSAATAAGTSLIPFDGITATNVQDGLAQENAKAIHKDTANEYSTITEKTTFADADVFLMEDSAAGFAKKKWTFSNFFSYFVNTKTVSTLNTTSKILTGAINEVRAGGINASAVDVSTWALGEERPIGARKNATTGAPEFAPNIGVIDVYALSTTYKNYLTTEANWLDTNGRPVATIITGWGLQCQRYTTTDYVYECVEDNKWTRYPLVATLDIYNVPAAAITAITTAGNWTGVNYTGTALTGCWKGMRYVSATYVYEFYDDNIPCRTARV